MTIINKYAAESWDKVYTAFTQINFTSFDYDTVKESLIQYLQIYYAESYNDMIESSELIAILEMFAYAAELITYRIDVASHENFITTAQRKQSILRLAKLISYSASRNIPARGLVKLNTVRTDQTVYDSLGNNLANVTITWNDPSNTNWKEQFFLVINLSLTTTFGQPSKSFQVADVLMQQYTFNNNLAAFNNGVFAFNASTTTQSVQMEAVPIDIDSNGPFERAPDLNAQFNIVYASDGRGDGSDYTGFLLFVKQGSLLQTNYVIPEPTANRRIELDAININNTDVWLYGVDNTGTITENWIPVNTLNDQTLAFNNNTATRKQYSIDTLENDRIAINFGDGNFSDAPVGAYQIWTRVSTNQDITVQKQQIVNQKMSFTYLDNTNVSHVFNMTFSLTSSLQNNSASETIEHVRQSAPSTYYAQDRMVNGQDYNTYMLKDSTILKLNTINRTFAGQPKYIEWNDASGAYQNIKLFGDDLTMNLSTSVDMVLTTASSQSIIDTYIEPLLQTNALLNTLTHQIASAADSYGIISYPRRVFLEDNQKIYFDINGNPVNPYGRQLPSPAQIAANAASPAPLPLSQIGTPLHAGDGSLLEKTVIQGALDNHWYGSPLSTVTINGTVSGVIPDPVTDPSSNSNLYAPNMPRTIDGINLYPPGDTGSGFQNINLQQYFGLKYNRFLQAFGTGDIALYNVNDFVLLTPPALPPTQNWGYGDGALNSITGTTGTLDSSHNPVPCPCNGLTAYNYKVEVLTIEMTSDSTTFAITSNIRGTLPSYSLSKAASVTNPLPRWSQQANVAVPCDFIISNGTTQYKAGDAFVIDISFQNGQWGSVVRSFGQNNAHKANLSGWWELIPETVINGSTAEGGLNLFTQGASDGPNSVQAMTFDQSSAGSSWIFLVASTLSTSGTVASWSIYNRDMKIIASSPTTKFWFNTASQILDPQTLKPLYDKIRILRSNLDELGMPLKQADIYDCVNFVYDINGEVITNSLELLPTDTSSFTLAGNGSPDNILQFENFAQNSYQFTVINVTDPTNPIIDNVLNCSDYTYVSGYDMTQYDINSYDSGVIKVSGFSQPLSFIPGSFMSSNTVNGFQIARQLFVPAPAVVSPTSNQYGCNITTGLDFMWQHYTPDSNLIDPSPSNIHDAFLLTSGYYNSVMDYVNGFTTVNPQPPTPLDLLTSYGYLLENKMLSDTLVLHSGKIKLLFGSLADQTLRAKFSVIMAPTATFSSERIKQEVINTINTYFTIQSWDFGQSFYATELISLIHQALPTQISSVVIVPTYSVNSFGSLFTINAGFDEVLQSCAQVTDVEIVAALTPSVIRQVV